jgi:hypothetical protein
MGEQITPPPDEAGIALFTCPLGESEFELGSNKNFVFGNSINGFCTGVLTDPTNAGNHIVLNSFVNIDPGPNILTGTSCP